MGRAGCGDVRRRTVISHRRRCQRDRVAFLAHSARQPPARPAGGLSHGRCRWPHVGSFPLRLGQKLSDPDSPRPSVCSNISFPLSSAGPSTSLPAPRSPTLVPFSSSAPGSPAFLALISPSKWPPSATGWGGFHVRPQQSGDGARKPSPEPSLHRIPAPAPIHTESRLAELGVSPREPGSGVARVCSSWRRL